MACPRPVEALQAGAFSDLSVQCGDYTKAVHKNILCTQSDWFDKAVSEARFKEGKTGIITFEEQTPAAVHAMLEFLYTGDIGKAEDDAGDEMLRLLDIYAIAEFILELSLREMAQSKLRIIANKEYMHAGFTTAVQKAYAVSPPGSTGDELRMIVTQVLAKNANKIFAKQGAPFEELMASIPGLGDKVALVLGGFTAASGPVFGENGARSWRCVYRCPLGVLNVMSQKTSSADVSYCPFCGGDAVEVY